MSKLNLEKVAASMSVEQLEELIKALEKKSLMIFLGKDDIYAARWFDVGWWVWKLEPGSAEYFVRDDFSNCTCPMFEKFKSCKHIQGLKHGSNTSGIPFDEAAANAVRKKRKVFTR